jgi:hypothetical protein
MVMTLAILLANLVVDLVYGVLDPRIRTQPSMRAVTSAAPGESTPGLPLELPA